MRAIYLNFAIETVRAVEASGREGARVLEPDQLARARDVFSTQRTYADFPEMKLLRRRMQLPGWWDRVELSEFSDDDVDELDIVAAMDIPGETMLAKVGGVVYPEPTKYTIRLAIPSCHKLSHSVKSQNASCKNCVGMREKNDQVENQIPKSGQK